MSEKADMAGAATDAEWHNPTLIWHTYPLGLLGADQSGPDRSCRLTLRDVAEWLPHIGAMGADTLLLAPVFASLSHGYDTVTHRDIDDRLGTVADLDALITAASAHGIGVVLDGAFAYASRSFWRLDDAAETLDPWFLRDDDGLPVPWRVDSLVTPDYGSVGYQSYVANVLSSWLDRGIRGWRLDSSWSVPAAFWRKVLARVRTAHPAICSELHCELDLKGPRLGWREFVRNVLGRRSTRAGDGSNRGGSREVHGGWTRPSRPGRTGGRRSGR